MQKYKGVYIDGVFIHSKEEVDSYLKQKAVERLQMLCHMFVDGKRDYSLANMMEEAENRLHEEFGMGWEEIETITINAYC